MFGSIRPPFRQKILTKSNFQKDAWTQNGSIEIAVQAKTPTKSNFQKDV